MINKTFIGELIVNLVELRKTMEYRLKPLVVINKSCPMGIITLDCTLVVLEDSTKSINKYSCYKYFQIGTDQGDPYFQCSQDRNDVNLESVWDWLNNPQEQKEIKTVEDKTFSANHQVLLKDGTWIKISDWTEDMELHPSYSYKKTN